MAKDKEEKKKYNKQYYQANKKSIAERKKKYNQLNKERIFEQRRQFRKNNEDRLAANIKRWRESNKEKITKERKEPDRIYYLRNKNKIIENSKQNYLKNRENIIERIKKYSIKNKDKITKYKKQYVKNNRIKLAKVAKEYSQSHKKERSKYENMRRRTNSKFALTSRLRGRLWQAFKLYSTTGKTKPADEYGIDYTAIIEHLKPFPLERWRYHIDHIIPLWSFDFDDPEQIKEAFAPSNHQWLLIEDNLSKGGKIIVQSQLKF